MNEQKESDDVTDDKPKVTENGLVRSTTSLNAINLLDATEVAKAEVFLQRMMKSSKGGITSVQDGLAVIARAQDLNLPFTTCLEHIHVINGKTGVDIHIIKALLSRAGITWTCDEDYIPLYEYTDGINVYNDRELPDYCIRCKSEEDAIKVSEDGTDKIGVYPVAFFKDFNGNIYRKYQLNDKFAIAINVADAKAKAAQGKFPIYRIPAVPVDYVTSYTFTRHKMINGKEVVITAKSKFSYSEAMTAKLFEKSTYQQYSRTLIGHRAFTYGARDIASDILFGVMETTELKIVSGKELDDRDIIEIQAEAID